MATFLKLLSSNLVCKPYLGTNILAKNLGIQGAGSPAAAEGRCSGCQRSQRPTTATGAVKEPYRGRAAAAVLLRSTLIW